MGEMVHAGEDHGKALVVGSRNRFVIAVAAARLLSFLFIMSLIVRPIDGAEAT